MTTRKFLCASKNGKQIYYDPVDSHAATHFGDTAGLKKLVVEVLKNRYLNNNNTKFDVDVGRVIGTTDVVEVDDTDDIIYAIRKNRREQGYVPFTRSRKAQDSSYISISLILEPDGSYTLSSAWVGKWDDPPFPQEPHAKPESKDYWHKHAFVWGSQEIETNTETLICPW